MLLVTLSLFLSFSGAHHHKKSKEATVIGEEHPGKRVGVIDIDETGSEQIDASLLPGMWDDHGFRFIRVIYQDRRSRWMWATDYPTADDNLQEAIDKTTKIDIAGQYLALTLKDERIFEHPIMYLTEPGNWITDETEVQMPREYFDRGGFVIFDDFHYEQWFNFYNNIKLVFPDREPVEIPPDHPVRSVYYNIDPVEAPSTKPRVGRYEDQYYAIYDDLGPMRCVISYNQDIGDGWEWPDRNISKASTISLQMAINFIMYAYTH